MNLASIAFFIQLFFGIVIGTYFWTLLKKQRSSQLTIERESKKELAELKKLRSIRLNEPLSEKIRPKSFDDIVGQKDGIRALKAALCGPNPQHVIIYGPPGVGKTAAARVVLEEAKKNDFSPFRQDAVFVEIDGATARFDERGIADPLIGSVHDPIYQGAGAMGQAGIPQPKQGAVTKAHGGILFIDEIGELHPIQINKLLKVLEDRKVFLESAYYSEENEQIPDHIHDIFQNGLPADFRLISATTRSPEEIPPAIRSRCMEIYFKPLTPSEIKLVTRKAVKRIGLEVEEGIYDLVAKYATNGREAVNIIQLSAGMVLSEKRKAIAVKDVEWIIHSSQRSPRREKQIHKEDKVGFVNGLGLYGPNMGSILEIEATVMENKGKGAITITGIVEEESTGNQARTVKRKSMAKGSVENVLTVLRNKGINTADYDIHVNFPGGIPVDGPSAGITIATAIYSAIYNLLVPHNVAMTGELSIHGDVKPIGGVVAKVEAAKQAGATDIIIPKSNFQSMFHDYEGVRIHPVETLDEVLEIVFSQAMREEKKDKSAVVPNTASYALKHSGV